MTTIQRYLTLRQAATYTGKSETWLYRNGQTVYNAVKVGGCWSFDRIEIDKAHERRKPDGSEKGSKTEKEQVDLRVQAQKEKILGIVPQRGQGKGRGKGKAERTGRGAVATTTTGAGIYDPYNFLGSMHEGPN